MSHSSLPTLQRLHREAECLLVARTGERAVAGFLLAMNPRSDYESPNFRYFQQRFDSFVYVDRVVVHTGYRGLGIGARLYQALLDHAGDAARLTCEVNLEPPNPGSIRFHERLGFVAVDEQATESGTKRVALMVREPRVRQPRR